MLRAGEKFRRRRGFEDFATVDKHHPIGNFAGKLHLVSDHHHGDTAVGQGFHHLQHFADHLRIQRRGWFIKQDDLRRGGKGAGDGDALLLAAGELSGHLPRFIRETDLGE